MKSGKANLFQLFSPLVFLALASCTHSVHLVNFSDARQNGSTGRPIQAQSEQFVVLGFSFDTAYVDQAYRRLQGQCTGGTITAIATKYYTDHGFLSWTHRIVMDASCIEGTTL